MLTDVMAMESHDGGSLLCYAGVPGRETDGHQSCLPRERVQVSAYTSTGTQHRVDGVKAFFSFFYLLAKESQRRKAKVGMEQIFRRS